MTLKYDWRVIGHEKILARLEKDIITNNIASATLLLGPDEIGKSCIMKAFAGIVQSGGDYSRDSDIVKQIEKNIHPDVVTVGALWQKDKLENFEIIGKSSNFDQKERKKNSIKTDIISIDDVKSFSERLYEKPTLPFKICLIKNVHRMQTEAANAFLKILEEPPSRTIFLLTARHEGALLPTLVSRTRVLQLNLVPQNIIQQYIDNIDLSLSDEEKLELLIITQGRPARLKRFLDDPDFMAQERMFFHQISSLLSQNSVPQRMRFAEKLVTEEGEFIEFFNRFIHFLRSLLIEKIHNREMLLVKKLSHYDIINLIEQVNKAKYLISKNVNKKMTIENLFLQFPQLTT